jgi:Arc/MetJ-type ribon-helix-helix transcriptional regulator
MPLELKLDLERHVGDSGKFVSLADAVRTACRKMLDHLDDVDFRAGRRGGEA